MSKSREYKGVTPAKILSLINEIEQQGGRVSSKDKFADGPESGSINLKAGGLNFKFDFEWDGKDILKLTCTKKSFVVGYGKLWTELDKQVKEFGVTPV